MLDRRSFLAAAALLALAPEARAARPSRIVCAGTDVTETVVALAGLDAVKGVDITSRTPPAVRTLPSIGYLRQISVEGILSLQPDLLISNRDLGPPAAVEQLRGTGLRVELIEGELDGEGIAAKVRHIGEILQAEAKAATLATDIEARMAGLARQLAGIERRPSVAFVRTVDNGMLITAGKLPLVDAAFRLAGGRNAFAEFSVFKPVSKEVFVATPPDFVVASHEEVSKAGGDAAFLAIVGLPADQPGRLAAAEVTSLFGFAPSSVAEIETLAHRLHPGQVPGGAP